MMNLRSVGLESWGVYLPTKRHTSKYMAKKTGIPQKILESKFGLKAKTIPDKDDHTVRMGAMASEQALERVGISPEDLDVLIWAGEVYSEYPMQTYGIKLQKYLGCPQKPWAFDINQRCGTFIVGLLLAKGLMQLYPNYKRILVASGYRNCDLIDYQNTRVRFMYSLAASGVAAIVKADTQQNEILGISAISDGRFADDVYIPYGGTVNPITADAIANNLHKLDVSDPEGLKTRLDQFSMTSFVRVIDDALHQSGYSRENIDYLALLHMKRSAFEYVANAVGIDPYKQAEYLDDIGHNGQNDGIISLERGIKNGKIKKGNVIVLTAAGIGWAWNAAVIKWG